MVVKILLANADNASWGPLLWQPYDMFIHAPHTQINFLDQSATRPYRKLVYRTNFVTFDQGRPINLP